MKQKLIAVRDLKVETYLGISVVRNVAEAQRVFMDTLTSGQRPFAKHHRDFAVHVLADVDLDTGELFVLERPKDVTPYQDVDDLDQGRLQFADPAVRDALTLPKAVR